MSCQNSANIPTFASIPSLLSSQRRTAPILITPLASAMAAISRYSGTRVATKPFYVPSTPWTKGRTAVPWIAQRDRYILLNNGLVLRVHASNETFSKVVSMNLYNRTWECNERDDDYVCPGYFNTYCPDNEFAVQCGCAGEVWMSPDCREVLLPIDLTE